ncbi:MAG: PDDEXK nuclease domain-containing protein [Sedimentisphaerales bacterium]
MKAIKDKMSLRGYGVFFKEIKEKIASARITAYRGLNRELIKLYWDIGKTIVERQDHYGWGQGVVEKLANDLRKEFDNAVGYSVQNLWYMRQFFLEYKDDKILQQAVGEIPWGQNILIFSKVKDIAARRYYVQTAARMGWSRNVLLNQINANAYGLSLKKKQHNFVRALPVHLAEQAEESLKSVYNFDFLGITKPILEKELERRLVEKVKQFILELGYGFTFVGNQYRLALEGQEYFIDLLFFNRRLKSLVAVELKTGKFEPEYAGKMDFYLNLLNDKVKLEDENPSIGIILCAEKNNLVVEYALRNTRNPIGVAQYHLTAKLPQNLKGILPSVNQLRQGIKKEIAEI